MSLHCDKNSWKRVFKQYKSFVEETLQANPLVVLLSFLYMYVFNYFC